MIFIVLNLALSEEAACLLSLSRRSCKRRGRGRFSLNWEEQQDRLFRFNDASNCWLVCDTHSLQLHAKHGSRALGYLCLQVGSFRAFHSEEGLGSTRASTRARQRSQHRGKTCYQPRMVAFCVLCGHCEPHRHG
jgi:hypothetical protein